MTKISGHLADLSTEYEEVSRSHLSHISLPSHFSPNLAICAIAEQTRTTMVTAAATAMVTTHNTEPLTVVVTTMVMVPQRHRTMATTTSTDTQRNNME